MKEWARVNRTAQGVTTVTVTLVEGNISSRWSVKTGGGSVKVAYGEAKSYAERSLTELQEVASS